MLNEISREKLDSWRSERKTRRIDLSKIIVSHPVHLQTETVNFNGKINKMSYSGKRQVPIVLRKISKNNYQLLFGLKQLITAKLLNLSYVDAVIVSCSRKELINYLNNLYKSEDIKTLDTNNIKIPEPFTKTPPRKEKVKLKKQLINQGIIKPIEINENNVLTDGYITYLILKEKGYTEIPVIYAD